MPTQQDLDQKALDYGVLVAGISQKKKELDELTGSITDVVEKKEKMEKELAEGKEAADRLHKEVIDLEKELEAKNKLKVEEVTAEDRRLSTERASLAAAVKQQTELADQLDKRETDLKSKDAQLKDQLARLEQDRKALAEASVQTEEKAKTAGALIAEAQTLQKATEKQAKEVGEQLRAAKAAESNAKAAEQNVKKMSKQADDDRSAAESAKQTAETAAAGNTELLRQIKLFNDVLTEHVQYIADNVKNPDAILNHFATQYPALADVLHGKTKKK